MRRVPPAVGKLLQRLRSAGVNLSLVIAGFGVALILGEGAVRVLRPRGFVELPSTLFRPHPILGRVMTPNIQAVMKRTRELSFQVTTNSNGLRDREIGPKPSGGKRILVLGDSFTWGDGVDLDDTYAKRLERLLNERCGGGTAARYQVINAAVPEYGPAQMWLYLKHYGVKLAPDIVLLGLFDLDVYRNEPYLTAVFDSLDSSSYSPAPSPKRSRLTSLKIWLKGHSYLYNVVAVQLVSSPVINEWLEKTGIRVGKPREFISAGSGHTDRVMAESEKIVRMMREFVEQRGEVFMATYIPTAAQVQALAKGQAVDDQVVRMMERVFQDAPDLMVGLGPRLAEASRQAVMYFPWDGHWAAAGHRIAAETLWPSLAKVACEN